MKTVLYGRVTESHLADASLFCGIAPTEFITNGSSAPPTSKHETSVIRPDPMVGDCAAAQNHWRMVLHADALICVGKNDHLMRVAETIGLIVYQVDR